MHAPWAGSISEAEKEARAGNPDWEEPLFSRNQWLNPWRGKGSSSVLTEGLRISEGETG
jgi:hypothetical protein